MNKLYIAQGDNPFKMTIDLLHKINPLKGKDKDIAIGIKPNLVCASPASEGATTHPEIIEGIITYLLDEGFKDIKIIEGSWVGDSTKNAFKVCGYEEISIKYNIPLIDLKDDSYIEKTHKDTCIKICNKPPLINLLCLRSFSPASSRIAKKTQAFELRFPDIRSTD